MSDPKKVLESLRAELQAIRAEMHSLKSSNAQADTQERPMQEDVDPEYYADDLSSLEVEDTRPWATVLGASTVEATHPAALTLASLLASPPPIGASERGVGESENVQGCPGRPPSPTKSHQSEFMNFASKVTNCDAPTHRCPRNLGTVQDRPGCRRNTIDVEGCVSTDTGLDGRENGKPTGSTTRR